jgi:SAM-dependent methyltransferase
MAEKQSARQQTAPSWGQQNMRPTLNGTGFMFEVLDEFADEFIQYSGTSDAPVAEIGCAFGVATLPALAAGATVVACDLAQAHLDILAESAPAGQRDRLTCVQGELPYLELPENHFSALLCSRVLHFLDGAAIDASVRKFFSWLRPGGRLFLVADTPYGIWRKFVPLFEAKRERGDRWPGLMFSIENFLPQVPSGRAIDGPPFMNLLTPDLMERSCREAGFMIDRVSFIDRSDFGEQGRMDGRENAGVMAHKPA